MTHHKTQQQPEQQQRKQPQPGQQQQQQQKPRQEDITDAKDHGIMFLGAVVVMSKVLLVEALRLNTVQQAGIRAETAIIGPRALGAVAARTLASSWPEDDLYNLTVEIGENVGGRTYADCGAGWPSIPGEKVTMRTLWMDGSSCNHLTTLSNNALGLGTFATDDEMRTCCNELVDMLRRLAEKRSSNLPMWNETAVHKNGHVINKAGLHLWMQLYVANSVELDVNTDLQQISAALFDNRQAIPTWFYGVLRAFESDQVMILRHDTATRLELRESIRLVSESLVCLIVCSACNISCRHDPWPKGSVLLIGWQRELLMPGGIVIIISSQVGTQTSPRLRSEEAVGKALHSRLLSYRGRVAKQSTRTSDVSPTDLKQQKLQRRQSLGAPRGQCGTRYKANTQVSHRADVDPMLAWPGVSLFTDPRWGMSTVIMLCATFGLSAKRQYAILPHSVCLAHFAGSR